MKSIIIPAVALVAGLGIGNAGSESRVETREVVKEVPGPERVKKIEVEVEKRVVPDGCKKAISAAREVADISARFADVSSSYVRLIPQAFEAGVAQSEIRAQGVINEMEKNNGKVGDLTEELTGYVNDFNGAAGSCK